MQHGLEQDKQKTKFSGQLWAFLTLIAVFLSVQAKGLE